MLELLYKALHAPHGIVVSTNDVERLRQKLYAARRESSDESLSSLSFLPSRLNPTTELWIVNRNGEEV